MKVKMLRTRAMSPESLRAGEQQLIEGKEYDLDNDEAKILIEQGIAEPAGAKAAKAHAAEAATDKGVEVHSEYTGPERQSPPHQTPEPPKSRGK